MPGGRLGPLPLERGDLPIELRDGLVGLAQHVLEERELDGRVSTVILGGFRVTAAGDLANWNVPEAGVGGIGGAMGLAAGGGRVIVLMYQRDKQGRSKLVPQLTYPATALGCVRDIVTDLAYIQVDSQGFVLREVGPGLTVDDVKAACAAAGSARRARDDLRLSRQSLPRGVEKS